MNFSSPVKRSLKAHKVSLLFKHLTSQSQLLCEATMGRGTKMATNPINGKNEVI